MEGGGLGEEVGLVDHVEAAGTLAGHLHVLLLILADGHLDGAVDEDVGGHEGGIGQETGVDVVGLLADFLLEGGDTLELAEVGVHVEVEVKLKHLVNVALDIDGGFVGVEAAGEVFGEDGADAAPDVDGARVGGQGVPVGNKEEAAILVLHAQEALDGSEIVAQLQIARGADTAHDGLQFLFFSHSIIGLLMCVCDYFLIMSSPTMAAITRVMRARRKASVAKRPRSLGREFLSKWMRRLESP